MTEGAFPPRVQANNVKNNQSEVRTRHQSQFTMHSSAAFASTSTKRKSTALYAPHGALQLDTKIRRSVEDVHI